MELEELRVLITAETKGLRNELGKLQGQLRNTEKQTNKVADNIKKAFKGVGTAIAGAFAIKQVAEFGKEALSMASSVEVSFLKLQTVLASTGKSFANAYSFINKYTQDGLVSVGQATEAYANLAQRGYNTDQIQTVLDIIKESAMVGRQAGLTVGEAVITATQGIKQGNSVLLDNAGIQTNLAKMWQNYAKEINTSSNNLSEYQKIIAEVNGIQQEAGVVAGIGARYSELYAGKVAKLTGVWEEFKLKVGNVVKVVAKPIVEMVTICIQYLNKLMDYLIAVLEFFGINVDSLKNILKDGSSGMKQMSDEAGGLADNVEGATDNVKDLSREINRLQGFDEINLLGKDTQDALSSGIDTGGATGGGMSYEQEIDDLNAMLEPAKLFDTTNLEYARKIINEIINKAKKLKELFLKGLKLVLDISDIEKKFKQTTRLFEWLGKAMTGIFKRIGIDWYDYLDTLAETLGTAVGAIIAVVGNTVLGVAQAFMYAFQNSYNTILELFKGFFNGIYDSLKILQEAFKTLAKLSDIFFSAQFVNLLSDIFSIILELGSGALNLLASFTRDMLNLFTKPFIDNCDAIIDVVKGLLDVLHGVFKELKLTIRSLIYSIINMYNQHIKPLIDTLAESFSKILGRFLELVQQYVLPVLQSVGNKLQILITMYIKPCIESIINFIGKVADCLKALWENYLEDFVMWLINTVVPIVSVAFKTIADVVIDVVGIIINVVKNIIDVLSGIVDFLTAVFKGDWEGVWNACVDIFDSFLKIFSDLVFGILGGIWDFIKNGIIMARVYIEEFVGSIITWFGTFFDDLINSFTSFFGGIWDIIKSTFDKIWNFLKPILETIGNFFKTIWNAILNTIKTVLNAIWNAIKTVWNGISNTVKSVMNGISSVIRNIWNGVCNTLGNTLRNLGNLFSNIFGGIKDTVSNVFGNIKNIFNNIIDFVKNVFTGAWDSAWTNVKNIFKNIFDMLGGIFSGAINIVIKSINWVENCSFTQKCVLKNRSKSVNSKDIKKYKYGIKYILTLYL